MTDTLTLRDRFDLDDRAFLVLAEPCYDEASEEWAGRLLYLPLDRSLPRALATAPVRRARKRDELLRRLAAVTDRELARALRTIAPPLPQNARSRRS